MFRKFGVVPRAGSASFRVPRAVLLASLWSATAMSACVFDRAPKDLGRTPPGTGARVRYDLANKPLPAIPLPNDTATWPDPTSRTGVRVNASLVAPTTIEQQARERFSKMEGWGTFSPLSVSFDVEAAPGATSMPTAAALDLGNVATRHRGDDYDFANDAVYLVNLKTGVPMVLDLGDGSFDYTLKKLDSYWANDTRDSERNLLFETIDETNGGAVTEYAPEHDTDFDGLLDVPNLDNPKACPSPDAICDDRESGDVYDTTECKEKRRERDRCIADHLLTFYERQTDTLIMRPLLPLDEMTRYAVVVTDRLVDREGKPVRSPFDHVFHPTQRHSAELVETVLNNGALASYFGDLSGTGLEHVAFLWSFTTQPTVDDMKRLRDGLFGEGPFARWADAYPAELEVQRAVGLVDGLASGAEDAPGWQTSELGKKAGCAEKAENLFVVEYDAIKNELEALLTEGFGLGAGPGTSLLMRRFDAISHMVIATFKSPYLLEGGPSSTDPNAAFDVNYVTGEGTESSDTVQVWMIVPKETAQHQQPFDVNIYGHGYTGNFLEMIFYAGNLAEHGVATVGINAMGHGLVLDSATRTAAGAALGGACFKPFADALQLARTRDLNRDGEQDSGGDFWSSYLFHTRDGVRQSILDHLQLVRIMRAFGGDGGMRCRDDGNKGKSVAACDANGDGTPAIFGDFDDDGRPDLGGPDSTYGTWGESLGGILSAIHGAIDAYVTSAVPGSGGGGLTDVGVRSFQGGVVEAVLLRIWGPLLVTVPATARKPCTPTSTDGDRCTVCGESQLSLRYILPDVNGTGEVEAACLEPSDVADTTVLVRNLDNGEVRCASVDDKSRFRVGLPSTTGDRVHVTFWQGKHKVKSYDGCELLPDTKLVTTVAAWGKGRVAEGTANGAGSATCEHATCSVFQGRFFGEGKPLTSPGDGYGIIRQTPALRRFLGLAQAALEPGDPISFAPYYALKSMTDPFGEPIAPHAVLTLNTIGDMNVPLNAGIAFARATGALPFLRPDQAALYPEYLDYVTPEPLYVALGGRTPNRDLIENHVVEGIAKLARHPASAECAASQNAATADATYLDKGGAARACFPTGCTEATEGSGTPLCYSGTHCDFMASRCVANALGQDKCDEALYDADDLDEGKHRYFEHAAPVPHRLARLTGSAATLPLDEVWGPRLRGVPYSADATAYAPKAAPAGRLTALLDAYTVPEGEHCFVNGEPCQGFDHGTYLTNLVARFFQSDGTDLYYLSHPTTHHCLAAETPSCDYAAAK